MENLEILADKELLALNDEAEKEVSSEMGHNISCAGLDSYDAFSEGAYEYAWERRKRIRAEMRRRGLPL